MSSPASSAQSEKPTRSVNTIASRSSPGFSSAPSATASQTWSAERPACLRIPGRSAAASPSRRATTARASEPVVESGSP